MHYFKIKPESIDGFRKPVIIKSLMLFVCVIFLVVILPELLSDAETKWDGSWLYMVILFGALFVFTIYMSLKKQKASLESYRLTITDDALTREVLNTDTITIVRRDVQEIIQNANGSLTIIGASKINAIGVPAQIERKEELTSLLTAIMPFTVKTSTPWLAKFQFPIALLIVGLLFLSFYVNNKFIAAIGAFVFCVVMIFSFIVIQKSKNVDKKIKRMSYIMFIPLLSIIYSVISKLME